MVASNRARGVPAKNFALPSIPIYRYLKVVIDGKADLNLILVFMA